MHYHRGLYNYIIAAFVEFRAEMFLFLNFKNELHAAASMSNEASRPDLDFMSPEYALRGNDADVIQVSFILLNLFENLQMSFRYGMNMTKH